MLFRSLLLCDPFGGVYKPGKKSPACLHSERPLMGVSVFNKDVRYPKPAIPLDLLPDELLQRFQETFESGLRGEFEIKLLKNFRWHKCIGCSLWHGRPTCPSCQKAAPAAVRAVIQVRGKVTSTRIFKTRGEILYATSQNGEMLYVYREGAKDFREGGRAVGGAIYLGAKIRISRDITMYGQGEKVWNVNEIGGQVQTDTSFVDVAGNQPAFDANHEKRYWIVNGTLFRNVMLGPERIGDVLQNQTLFWVGPTFGFGFYKAGALSVAFVFGADKGGLNDTVKPPPMNGQLVDATAYFSNDFCWFLYSVKEGSRLMNRAVVITKAGVAHGLAEAEAGDSSWLGSIHGKCASGAVLFSVTDDGLVRLGSDGTAIAKTAEFPDAEPFVHSGCSLFPAKGGLYIVDRQEIRLIKIG
jgi:H/ACA ribonucleoprotein complex subunit 3